MFILEVTPSQLVYLSDLLAKVESVPGDKAMEHASIRQMLSQPQLTEKVVEKIKQDIQQGQTLPVPAQQ